MKRLFLFILCSCCFSYSCSDNTEIFTEDLNVEIPFGNLTEFTQAGFADISMTDESTIQGFTRDFYFSSNNLLKTYTKTWGGINYWNPVYSDEEVTTIFGYNGNTFELSIIDRSMTSSPTYSTRFTLSPWERVKINEYYYNGFIDYETADFVSESKGWIAANYERSSNGPSQDKFPHGIRIYEVNGSSHTLITTIEGFTLKATAISFRNETEGIVLGYKTANGNLGYVFKTTDGGQHWEQLYSFSHIPTKIFYLDETTLLVECKDGYLQSSDNGVNWTFVSMPKEIYWTSVGNDGIIYALEIQRGDSYAAIGRLKISEDKGITWKIVEGDEFYGTKICFFDRLHGIAYSDSILQYTKDGGESWQLIAFPINI